MIGPAVAPIKRRPTTAFVTGGVKMQEKGGLNMWGVPPAAAGPC